MKTKLFLKTLLVAVCLLVGSNGAWAQTLVGSTDNTTGWWSAFSDYFTIEPNHSVTVTFKNYSDKAQTHDNYLAVLCSDADRGADGYSEYVVLRADAYGWQGSKNTNDDTTWFTSRSNSFNWETFKDDMDGADVSITVTRTGASTRLYADITTSAGKKLYQQMTLPCGDGTQNIRLFLTTEKGHLTNVEKSEWEQLVEYDFETQASFTTDWPTANGGNGQESIWGSRLLEGDVTTSHYFMTRDFGGKGRVTTHTISNTSFRSAAIWKIEFDFAMYGSSTNNNYLQLNGASGALFKFTGAKDWGNTESTITNSASTQIGTFDCDPYASSNRGGQSADGTTSVTKWYHATVIGNTTGVFLTVDKSDGTSVLASTKVSDFVNPTTITMSAAKTFGQVAIDDVKFFKIINPFVTTKYELSDGTTLIDDVETEVIKGNSFTPSYPASFQSGTKQYTYVSGGDEIASVTADQTVTIVYDEDDMPAGTYYAQTFEKNGSLTGWTTGNSARYNPTILGTITNKYLSVGRQGTGDSGTTITCTTFNQTVDENTDFTLKFDVLLKNAYQSETSRVSTFQIADYDNAHAMLKLTGSATGSTTWIINDNVDQTVTLSSSTWYTVQYSRIGSLTYLTITPQAGGEAVFAQQQISTLSTDGGLGKLTFGTDRYNADLSMDNILVRAWQDGDTPVVTETTYTIQYRDEEGNEIKDDVVNPTTVGAEDIVASSSEIAAFYNDGRTKKYIYKSGNTPITAVADGASNVITLVFREADTYNYTVTNNLGTAIVAAASDFEGETIKVPFPRYELKDGTLYTKSDISDEYNYTFTLTSNNQAETITGYTDSNIPAVVFYAEGEDLEGVSTSSSGNILIRSSNSAVGYRNDADRTIFSNLPAGTYQIFVAYFKPSNAGISNTFTVGDNDYVLSVADGVNLVTTNSEEFTLTSASDVVWTAGTAGLDYIYIKQTGVSVTIPSSGFGTIASAYALDLDNVTVSDGTLTAYKVNEITKDYAKLAIVGGSVAAATGLILEGKPGATCTIPVAESGTDISSTNKLQAAVNATEVAADEVYILKSGEFHKVTTASTIPAGKAYLLADDVPVEARTLSFFFEDDETTTGIADVRSETSDVRGGFFDLQGRKINGQWSMVNGQLPKGLYIVNGKKVVIK